ncbi:MAG: hypothetical protein ACLRW5_14630 [Faecalibacterium prausnitzii]
MSYRAFWQRRCRAAAAGAVLKPQGGNCAVLPLLFDFYPCPENRVHISTGRQLCFYWFALFIKNYDCNGVQREHNKKLNNGLPILHKVPPKRDYGRYFCIMAEKGGTSHGGLTEKLSPFFHAKKQEVNAYGR